MQAQETSYLCVFDSFRYFQACRYKGDYYYWYWYGDKYDKCLFDQVD